MRGMKAYGKRAKDSDYSRRAVLEHAFGRANVSGDRAVTAGELLGDLGRGGRLHVRPEIFAEICGFVKPDGMDFEVPIEQRPPPSEAPELEPQREQAHEPGRNPDGSRAVNFMSTQASPEKWGQLSDRGQLSERTGAEGKQPPSSGAGAPPKKGLFDRMGQKAAMGIEKMSHIAGEGAGEAMLLAREKMQRETQQRGEKQGRASLLKHDKEMVRATQKAEDSLFQLQGGEKDKRNEAAAERLALRRDERERLKRDERGSAGNFFKQSHVHPHDMQTHGKVKHGSEKLGNMVGNMGAKNMGRFGRFLEVL